MAAAVNSLDTLAIRNCVSVSPGFVSRLLQGMPGADRCVQQYLAEKQYENLVVFYTGDRFRINVGQSALFLEIAFLT